MPVNLTTPPEALADFITKVLPKAPDYASEIAVKFDGDVFTFRRWDETGAWVLSEVK